MWFRRLFLALGLCAGLVVFTPTLAMAADGPSANPASMIVDADQLSAWLAKDDKPVVIDVRDEEEWKQGHLAGAVLLPLSQLSASQVATYGNRPIVLMCRSGRRAALAKEALLSQGVKNPLYVFDGGILAWATAGKPVATGP